MQAAKNAVASAKESAANAAASAKSGLDKAKATMQEKVDKMSANDPIQKDMATHKKEERIHQAEHNKHEAREHNAANRHATSGADNHHFTGIGTGSNTVPHAGHGGNVIPDYLTGLDHLSGYGTTNPGSGVNIPGHNNTRNDEYTSGLLGPDDGLNPPRDPRSTDAVYPQDVGLGLNPARHAP